MEVVNRHFLHRNPCRLMEVVGEPGVGKSAFLSHLQNHLKLRYTSLGGQELRVIRFSLDRAEADEFRGTGNSSLSDDCYLVWQLANASSPSGAMAGQFKGKSRSQIPVALRQILDSDRDIVTIIIMEGCYPLRDAVMRFALEYLEDIRKVFAIFESDHTLRHDRIYSVKLHPLAAADAARLLFNHVSSYTVQKEFNCRLFGLTAPNDKGSVLRHLESRSVAVQEARGIPFVLTKLAGRASGRWEDNPLRFTKDDVDEDELRGMMARFNVERIRRRHVRSRNDTIVQPLLS